MKLSVTIAMAVLLIGCGAAPKQETKLSGGEGVTFIETEMNTEKYPVTPQSYKTKTRNGVRNDKDKLKKNRERSLNRAW